jgi:hypothetical protein
MSKKLNIYTLLLIAGLLALFTNCQKQVNNNLNESIKIENTRVSAVIQIRATVRAKITSDGGSPITERGVCFDTVPNPTITSKKQVADSVAADSFLVRLRGLKPNQKYYVKAYARNNNGVGYGEEVSFTTRGIKIGDQFEGGVVFYLEPSGLKGLIAAQQGLDYDTTWGCAGTSAPGTLPEIGTGRANTLAIIKVCKTPGTAAQFADKLDYSSFSDWYLPSKDELTEMFKRRDVVIMNNAERWSSTEVDANTAWALSFDAAGTPVPVIRDKNTPHGVRPIRSFSY